MSSFFSSLAATCQMSKPTTACIPFMMFDNLSIYPFLCSKMFMPMLAIIPFRIFANPLIYLFLCSNMSMPTTACIPFGAHSSIRPSMSLASGEKSNSLRNGILRDAHLETLAFASYGYQVIKLECKWILSPVTFIVILQLGIFKYGIVVKKGVL